jgi:hypothetical protein
MADRVGSIALPIMVALFYTLSLIAILLMIINVFWRQNSNSWTVKKVMYPCS